MYPLCIYFACCFGTKISIKALISAPVCVSLVYLLRLLLWHKNLDALISAPVSVKFYLKALNFASLHLPKIDIRLHAYHHEKVATWRMMLLEDWHKVLGGMCMILLNCATRLSYCMVTCTVIAVTVN